ncbi:hypothetical protein SELMODRAFT_421052 [Selaginella moellendorffii]|uniref:Uncharacterized protein n=1 Tax=Selaginella moellendorffii TaxID=88036 RepID=D8SDZ5_SELML|nr:hypothetical protein SELMODRAFT_421052 [Selaginella moellendorffii]
MPCFIGRIERVFSLSLAFQKRSTKMCFVTIQSNNSLLKESHPLAIQTCSYTFEAVSHSVVYAFEIGGALVWEESTIDAGGPHAKAIKKAVHQISGSMHGLFMLREGATYWHPRMLMHFRMLGQEERDVVYNCNIGNCSPRRRLYEMDLKAYVPYIWNALNQLRGASSLKEEGDVDSILENLAFTDYNTVLESRLTELGEGYEQVVEACVAVVVWHYLFIEPNVVGYLLRDGFQHSMCMEARQRPYKGLALLGGLSLIGRDALLQVFQDFGENFHSWIVDIIRGSPHAHEKFSSL